MVPVLVQLPGAVTQNPGSPVLFHRPSHVGTAASSRPTGLRVTPVFRVAGEVGEVGVGTFCPFLSGKNRLFQKHCSYLFPVSLFWAPWQLPGVRSSEVRVQELGGPALSGLGQSPVRFLARHTFRNGFCFSQLPFERPESLWDEVHTTLHLVEMSLESCWVAHTPVSHVNIWNFWFSEGREITVLSCSFLLLFPAGTVPGT